MCLSTRAFSGETTLLQLSSTCSLHTSDENTPGVGHVVLSEPNLSSSSVTLVLDSEGDLWVQTFPEHDRVSTFLSNPDLNPQVPAGSIGFGSGCVCVCLQCVFRCLSLSVLLRLFSLNFSLSFFFFKMFSPVTVLFSRLMSDVLRLCLTCLVFHITCCSWMNQYKRFPHFIYICWICLYHLSLPVFVCHVSGVS